MQNQSNFTLIKKPKLMIVNFYQAVYSLTKATLPSPEKVKRRLKCAKINSILTQLKTD